MVRDAAEMEVHIGSLHGRGLGGRIEKVPFICLDLEPSYQGTDTTRAAPQNSHTV